jgi:hypothetical protein
LWAENLELPALLDHRKVRRAVLRLFGDAPRGKDFTKKLHYQQGLLKFTKASAWTPPPASTARSRSD